MEDLAKILKVFVDNHLLPTIGAITLALVTMIFIPTDYWAITKIGETWFRLLLFSCYFLAIEFLSYICKTLPVKAANIKYLKEQSNKQQDEAIKSWQNVFDHLTTYELELVKELVKRENNPVKRDYVFGPSIHSEFLGKDYRFNEYGGIPFVGQDDFQNGLYICATQFDGDADSDDRIPYRVYKLQNDAYVAAKYILEKTGRLSKFEEVKSNGN